MACLNSSTVLVGTIISTPLVSPEVQSQTTLHLWHSQKARGSAGAVSVFGDAGESPGIMATPSGCTWTAHLPKHFGQCVHCLRVLSWAVGRRVPSVDARILG